MIENEMVFSPIGLTNKFLLDMFSGSSFDEFYYLDKSHIVTRSLRLGV